MADLRVDERSPVCGGDEGWQVMITRFAGVLAGAYPRNMRLRTLIHIVELQEDGSIKRALCGQVKPENLNEDTMAPGAQGPATCERCLSRARRFV